MSPVRNWKRLFFVGCSHGIYADPVALDNSLGFAKRFQPHLVGHLGDFVDMACFRSGANGTADEGMDPQEDFDAGKDYVSRLFNASPKIKERVLFLGNHEDRLWSLANNPNQRIAFAAATGVNEIRDLAKGHKAELVDYGIHRGFRRFGDTTFLHGFWFNENALRDTAESFGKVCMAHIHRATIATGRRADHPTGYCVGTLSNIPAMSYAKARRATQSWSQGWVYGEYCSDETVLWLVERAQGKEWRLPL